MLSTVIKCSIFLFITCVIVCSTAVEETSDKSYLAYDFLYNEGVTKYLENDWEGCVKNFELALKGWHWWNDNTARCRKNCRKDSGKKDLLSAGMSEEDRFFERALYSTLCVVKCKKGAFGAQRDRVVENEVRENFYMRKPYDYLQLCYHKLGRAKDAADAAATVLAAQPEHGVMNDNLKYYMQEGSIKPEEVINLELREYGKEYIKGTLAYEKNDFETTISIMEKSLEMFYEDYQDCRFLCENPFNQGWYPDFISSIANHFTFTLRCKRQCLWRMSDLFGEIDDYFLASYFDYLQYSYFQLGETRKACEAVATYLTLYPEDQVQNQNKQFYITQDGVTDDMFTPRKEIVALKEQEDYEEKLLQLIETNFAFLTDEFWDEEDENLKAVEVGEALGSNFSTVAELDTSTVILSSENLQKDEI